MLSFSARSTDGSSRASSSRFPANAPTAALTSTTRVVGRVSMDNITVDLGPAPTVEVGSTATLIGSDGPERQSAEEISKRIGTINYEVVCWISKRVRRSYHRDGVEQPTDAPPAR